MSMGDEWSVFLLLGEQKFWLQLLRHKWSISQGDYRLQTLYLAILYHIYENLTMCYTLFRGDLPCHHNLCFLSWSNFSPICCVSQGTGGTVRFQVWESGATLAWWWGRRIGCRGRERRRGKDHSVTVYDSLLDPPPHSLLKMTEVGFLIKNWRFYESCWIVANWRTVILEQSFYNLFVCPQNWIS